MGNLFWQIIFWEKWNRAEGKDEIWPVNWLVTSGTLSCWKSSEELCRKHLKIAWRTKEELFTPLPFLKVKICITGWSGVKTPLNSQVHEHSEWLRGSAGNPHSGCATEKPQDWEGDTGGPAKAGAFRIHPCVTGCSATSGIGRCTQCMWGMAAKVSQTMDVSIAWWNYVHHTFTLSALYLLFPLFRPPFSFSNNGLDF